MINYRNAQYVKSVPDISYAPDDKLPEILLVGKSNVGKSSLINTLCDNKHLAKISATPGKTEYLNYYLIDRQYYLIDTPGYGFVYNRQKTFNKMMHSILHSIYLKGIVFLLDSRRVLTTNDKIFYNYLIDQKIPFFLVYTKSDKINRKMIDLAVKEIHHYFPIVKDEEILFVSNKNKQNVDKLKQNIEYLLQK